MGFYKSFVLLLLCFTTVVYTCPPRDELGKYCSCKELGMICSRLNNQDHFISAIQAIAKHHTKLSSLSIMFSSKLSVPNNIFNGTHIEEISFLASPVMSFSHSDVAFQGLEETLTKFTASRSKLPAQWNWNQLRDLQRLTLIRASSATLESIENPFPYLPKLRVLALDNNNIEFVVDFAFAYLPQMFRLWLQGNKISELKRNMFPIPAVNLRDIALSGNNLQHLPEDMFSNMPALKSVSLDKNTLTTLNEKPFRHAFETFSYLTLMGNPIRCDCRLKWITETRFPALFHGNCAFPAALKNVPLKNLDAKLLQC